MPVEYVKAAGVILSLAGTIILAFRVTKMLEVLTMSAKMVDTNMQVEAARASGHRDVPNIRMYGMTSHIEGVERLGTKLLVFGFGLQIVGSACTALSFFM
jgi:hypothetical protein